MSNTITIADYNGQPVQIVRKGTKNVRIKLPTGRKIKVTIDAVTNVQKVVIEKPTDEQRIRQLWARATTDLWEQDQAEYRSVIQQIKAIESRMHR